MANPLFEQMPALSPLDFFALTADVHYSQKKPLHRSFLLPDTSALLGEERFAEIFLGWQKEGLQIAAWIAQPFEQALYPAFSAGDALELFIDTRDLKTAGFITRFCHHFVILPQEVQGIRAWEQTRFRTEDTHPLCDPADLLVRATFGEKGYQLEVDIPAHCLHGYDPLQFHSLGFNFRCHRTGGPPQHFSVSSSLYAIEQHPRLWGSLKLCSNKTKGIKG